MSQPSLRWQNRIALDGGWTTWCQLAEEPGLALSRLGSPVALVCQHPRDPWEGLARAAREPTDLLMVGRDRFDAGVERTLAEAGYALARRDLGLQRSVWAAPAVPGRITVLSSGTTGLPKLVPHTLASLATVRAGAGTRPRCWLCPYAPGTYAWFQCALLGLTVPGQDVVPVDPLDADGWISAAESFGVDAVSATPTFWRRTLMTAEVDRLRALALVQLSLGGEPVDQSLLDRLHAIWPEARLTHLYASSEAGACIAVSDGRAGFPRDWLEAPRGTGVELRVEGDRLHVRSPFASSAAVGWIDTGDRVVEDGDRIRVVGRAGAEVINVGGAKVVADDVASVLADHPGVAWVRVRGRRAPIVGELPVAEVALAAGADVEPDDLIAWCAARLPEVAVPRRVTVVSEVPMSAALKAAEAVR